MSHCLALEVMCHLRSVCASASIIRAPLSQGSDNSTRDFEVALQVICTSSIEALCGSRHTRKGGGGGGGRGVEKTDGQRKKSTLPLVQTCTVEKVRSDSSSLHEVAARRKEKEKKSV